MMSKEEVKEVWQGYWVKNREGELCFDEMSGAIFSELLRNCGDVRGKKVLEAGCGRGMISARLAELGADVHLLDISPEDTSDSPKAFCLKKYRRLFYRRRHPRSSVCRLDIRYCLERRGYGTLRGRSSFEGDARHRRHRQARGTLHHV